jgi:predicted DsbA family dithiol-disulfide isomerase
VTDLQEGTVCGIDGCAPGDIGSTTQARTSVKKNLSIDIISDAICPWCWVAKRRLDRALASLAPDIVANVTWHPFELNPGVPKAGLDRRTYRSRKFGSWERSQALDAQVAATATPDGLDFRHDRMERLRPVFGCKAIRRRKAMATPTNSLRRAREGARP